MAAPSSPDRGFRRHASWTAFVASCLLAASGGAALAGDFAGRDILGFSANGSRFAFEEFGVQDGSGFPYCNIFVIDTAKDEWVPGSPVRKRIDDETARVATACRSAAEQAAPLIANIDERGDLLASNPITESGRDPYEITFKRRPALQLDNPDWKLRLERIALPATVSWAGDAKTFGYRLILDTPEGSRVLHEDKSLPESRGVPLDYRIHDVVIRQPFGQPASLAVIVMVLTKGFEGPDGRYLAVTAQLPG